MGLFDLFSGPPTPPTKEKFAQIVLAELHKLNPEGHYSFHEDKFQVSHQNEGFINLGNIFQEYCRAEKAEREALLRRFLRNCVCTKSFELPEEFDDIHPDLLPVIRSRFYLESIILQARARGNEPLEVPQQVVGEHLALSLVYDLPSAMRTIGQRDLDAWKVSFFHASEAARQNLEQMGEISFASLDGHVYASATGDNYDASRLIMLDLIRKFDVEGDHIAMVPNRDTLLVTGSEDARGLEIMAKIAEESTQKPRPISTIALRLEGDEWMPWLPPSSFAVYDKFHELRLQTLGMEYNDQKGMLDEIHNVTGEDVFVAQFSAIGKKNTCRVTSYCVWSEGVDTLLPQTDSIFFFRPGSEKEGELVAGGSWEHVQQVVGDLMEPAGFYPERYRVRSFPTSEQLAAIGKQMP